MKKNPVRSHPEGHPGWPIPVPPRLGLYLCASLVGLGVLPLALGRSLSRTEVNPTSKPIPDPIPFQSVQQAELPRVKIERLGRAGFDFGDVVVRKYRLTNLSSEPLRLLAECPLFLLEGCPANVGEPFPMLRFLEGDFTPPGACAQFAHWHSILPGSSFYLHYRLDKASAAPELVLSLERGDAKTQSLGNVEVVAEFLGYGKGADHAPPWPLVIGPRR